jgi:predicted MPP superfamily phosphohydrolase
MPILTPSNKRKAISAAAFVLATGLLCLAYAYFLEPSKLVVNRDVVFIKNWNRAFDGLKIVLIADIHGGSNNVTKEKIEEVVRLANAEKPDLTVLLGDYVSESKRAGQALKMPISEIAPRLKPLRAKYGVFAVLGNHDVWNNGAAIASELRKNGITVLEHQVATIDIGGADLRILGLKDHTLVGKWSDYSNEGKTALDASNGTGDVIVLSHSPDMVELVTGDLKISDDLKLFLAAHTHGGQVWFPLIGSPIVPSSYGQKYARGHVIENGLDMYVTTGIGTSILPIRFLVPPEIMVLNVRTER